MISFMVKANKKYCVSDPTCVTPDLRFFWVDGPKKLELWNGIEDELLLICQMLLPEEVHVFHPE